MDNAVKIGIAIYLVKALVDMIKWATSKEFWLWRAVALLVGMTVCVLFNVDLFKLVGLDTTIQLPFVTNALTGLLIGYLGTDLYDLISKWKTPTPTLTSTTLLDPPTVK